MSRETDLALKQILSEFLDNLKAKDVLSKSDIPMSAGNSRAANSSIRKVKDILGVLSAEAEAEVSGAPYKGTFIKDVVSVTDMRLHGRSSKEGVPTPLEDWGQYELLSYFLDLYFGRTGNEFPIETPGVKYAQFIKAKNKWASKVTRGLFVMGRIIKLLNGIEQAKAYIEWWFSTSFSNKPVSWGWLSSATMIAMFQSQVSVATVRQSTTVRDAPLPDDFVNWVDQIDGLQKYVNGVKTFKQLKYVYNAWSGRMNDSSHPVILMLREAMSRGLIKELT
jgi:hypothetical protein